METTIFFQRCTPEAGIKENLILEILLDCSCAVVGYTACGRADIFDLHGVGCPPPSPHLKDAGSN